MNLWTEIRDIKSGKKELREFGMVMALFFAILGGLALWRHKEPWAWFLIAAPVGVFAFLKPEALKIPQRVWMTLALLIGWVMTRVILSILFYGALTPIGLIARLSGKKFLNLSWRTGEPSYWVPRTDETPVKEKAERQF